MITASIFAKKDFVARDGTIPILLRLTIHRKVHPPIKLNKRTRPADWDDAISRVKISHPNADLLNKYLDRIQAKADDVLLKHELSGRVITYESFVRELSDLSPYDFYYLADQYYESKRAASWSYREKIRHIVNKLRDRHPRLELHQVDHKFVVDYAVYLQTDKKNCQNTINTNFKIFRRIFRYGVKQKLINENPFLDYRLPTIKTDAAVLTLEEVKKLEQLYRFELPYYVKSILTWFLLAVCTGRRFGDLQDFSQWKINKDHMHVTQNKRVGNRQEKKVVMIFINERIRTLLQLIEINKYKLPSNQKANKFLSEVIGLAGIDKAVTFHSARHTFASINKQLTEDITVRRDLLGHDSVKSTMIYEHTDQEQLKEVMLKWNNL